MKTHLLWFAQERTNMKIQDTGSQGSGVFEKLAAGLDTAPWSAVYRTLIGFAVLPAMSRLWGGHFPGWALAAFLLAVLLALRVGPAAVRRLLPFSNRARAIWAERRGMAKRYDSYQWQKLFWVGLGLACYIGFSGNYRTSPVVVASICLVSGALGLARWKALAARVRSGK